VALPALGFFLGFALLVTHLPWRRFLPLAHFVGFFFVFFLDVDVVTGAETEASGAWVRLPGATGPGALLNVP
jgi:hypothetical protein